MGGGATAARHYCARCGAAQFTTLASPGTALDADAYEAVSESVVWSFTGVPDDGRAPSGGLLADKWGNFYGTTRFGGANSVGTVYELSPPNRNSTQWTEQVLYSFVANSTDAFHPVSGLIADQWGNLYGTTGEGGTNGAGTVYELSPPNRNSTQWTEQVLWSFGGTSDDGVRPEASLLADKWGNLYSTTPSGGTNGLGTVFELSPPARNSSQWSEQVLYSFASAPDGYSPTAPLIADKSGNFYGTAFLGGAYTYGTVFELSPPYGKSRQWIERVLYSFGATNEDGVFPEFGLLADQEGNFYGTTLTGFKFAGVAFELSPPKGKSKQWSEQVLWGFGATTGDTAAPSGSLIADNKGNLYDTGNGGGAYGLGAVFELSPPARYAMQWNEQVLWSFGGTPADGQLPVGGVIADKWGNLYGTATQGGGVPSCGQFGCGIVFELSLPY